MYDTESRRDKRDKYKMIKYNEKEEWKV